MSEEIKVGDWVRDISKPNGGIFKVIGLSADKAKIQTALSPCYFYLDDLKKVIVIDAEDTPPSEVKGTYINADDLKKYLRLDNEEDHIIPNSEVEKHIDTFTSNHGIEAPQITHSEIKEIEEAFARVDAKREALNAKGGHMAGYGVDKVKLVQVVPETSQDYERMFFDNGLILMRSGDGTWKQDPLSPNHQEGLKHFFERKKNG